MRYLILLAIIATSCTRKTGGPPFVVCNCNTDTIKKTYGITNKYIAADTLHYRDSCNALQAYYSWDSCGVRVLAL